MTERLADRTGAPARRATLNLDALFACSIGDGDQILEDMVGAPADWLDQVAARGNRGGLILWLARAHGITEKEAARVIDGPAPAPPAPTPIDLDPMEAR